MNADRQAALAAIAEASGLAGPARFEEDPVAAIISIRGASGESLDLLEADVVTTKGVWHFDEAPRGPTDRVPTWRGYLVRSGEDARRMVLRLGDRAALADAWPELASALTPFELASLIARYHGRDAGLSVHHTVLATRADGQRLLAQPAGLPDKVAGPRLSAPRTTDGLATLSFFTSFVEPGPEGEPTIGLCYWKARWARDVPLAWDSLVIARRLPSAWAP